MYSRSLKKNMTLILYGVKQVPLFQQEHQPSALSVEDSLAPNISKTPFKHESRITTPGLALRI